jgi:glucose/arabinose dehydrogenase
MTRPGVILGAFVLSLACASAAVSDAERSPEYGPDPTLVAPASKIIPTVNVAPAKGWGEGGKPEAPNGMNVTEFARGLQHPRNLLKLPNGDILVVEADAPKKHDSGFSLKRWIMSFFMKEAGSGTGSANRITLLRDADGDGKAEVQSVFAEGLNSPFGITLIGNDLYVANTDGIVRFRINPGDKAVSGKSEKFVDLPAGPINHHWTKTIVANKDGSKIYASVGSNSNVGENGMDAEKDRALVYEIDVKTGQKRIYASGLRNAVGLAFEPQTQVLWAAVNERDELGDQLVPDYMTGLKDGAFYGWPYTYFGDHLDSRIKHEEPKLVATAIKPDYALGAHTASLGLTFDGGASTLPFKNGAFIGQHGSWNRTAPAGYKVVFVQFRDGKPDGMPKDVLTGFLNSKGEAYGRPVGVTFDKSGALLVAEDVGGRVWRVTGASSLSQK